MELIQDFKNYLLSQKNAASKATVKNYVADVKKFIAWIEAHRGEAFTPHSVTKEIIQVYKTQQSSTFSASSLDRQMSSLRKFFEFLKLEGKVASNPFEATAVKQTTQDPWHLKDFKDFLYVYNASHLTIKNYIIDVKQFFSWAEQVAIAEDEYKLSNRNVLAKVNDKMIEEYSQRLLHDANFSPATINRKLSSLRKYLTWAHGQGLLSNNLTTLPANVSPSLLPEAESVEENANIDLIQTTNIFKPIQGVARLGDPQKVPASDHVSEDIFGGKEGQDPEILTNKQNSNRTPTLENSSQFSVLSSQIKDGQSSVSQSDQQITLHHNSENRKQKTENRSYSPIPPIRLFQKLTLLASIGLEYTVIIPVAHAAALVRHRIWILKGKPLRMSEDIRLPEKPQAAQPFKSHVKNISKAFYNPWGISIAHFPLHKKVLYHIQYTRPGWYRRYSRLAAARYFNMAILMIFCAMIGFGLFTAFFNNAHKSPTLASGPVAPPRILSFQGRLTDNNDNPITTANTHLRFAIYDSTSATGSGHLLWQEVDTVSPDTDGDFATILGNGSACGSPTTVATGPCQIPASLFSQNASLWLGVTVENTAELAPRQQIATVAFATNSEFLQGLPPLTQGASGASANANTVLVLDSAGNVDLGQVSSTIQSSSGQFTLSGKTLTLATATGSNTNIQLTPDGSGIIDVQKPLQNSTLNNNIPSAAGAVEVDDLLAVLATSSGQSAFTINQTSTGPLISASTSGVAKFTVDNSGNTTAAGNITGQTIYTGGGTSYYINATTSNLNSLTVAGNLSVSGNIVSDLLPNPTNTYSLGSLSNQWLNVYAQNIFTGGQQLTQLWQRNLGALSPLNITDDVLIGATSTTSANLPFGFTGVTNSTQIATFSGTLSLQTTQGNNAAQKINLIKGSSLGFYTATTGKGDAGLGANPALYVANSGSIGVGTGSPNSVLDVYGAIRTSNSSSNYLQLANDGANSALSNSVGSTLFYNHVGASGTSLAYRFHGTTSDSALVSILNNGNVGIGSTGPTQALDVNGNIQAGEFLDQQNNSYFLDPAATGISLTLAGTEGIGTTSPLATLDVRSNLGTSPIASFSGRTSFAGLVVDNSGVGDLFTASSSGLNRFVITQNGNVGIGTSNPNNFFVQAAGSVGPQTTNTYDLGSNSLEWRNIYGQHIFANGVELLPYWQENSGALAPANITDDLLLGSTSTNSANLKFGFLNVAGGTPTATISANFSLKVPTTSNPAITLNALNGGSITFQTAKTGQYDAGLSSVFSIASNGNLTANGTSLIIGNGAAATIQTTNANLNLNTGSGTLTLNNGGSGAINFFSGSNALTSAGNLTLAGTATINGTGTSNIAGSLGVGTTGSVLATLDVRSQSGTTAVASASGRTSFAAVVANNDGIGDLFTASASSTTRFVIQNDGTLVDNKYSTDKGILYTNGTTGTIAQTGQGASNTVLHGNGSSAPTFSAVDLNNDTTGTLAINKGGTNGTATPTGGGVAYGTGTAYAFTTAGSSGQCLLSNASSAPSWGLCTFGNGNYWDLQNGALYPFNPTQDFLIGASATTSAKFAVLNISNGTPTASASSGLNGTGMSMDANGNLQTANDMTLTVGGSTTGNIVLKPQNGNGTVTLTSDTLATTKTGFNLINTTATSINFGGAATSLSIGAAGAGTTTFGNNSLDDSQATLSLFSTPTTVNFGSASQATNLKGNTTLGTNTSNTVLLNGLVDGAGLTNNAVQPVGNGTTDLGSITHYWATIYADNFIAPVGGGTSGFWTLSQNVLSPVNSWNDLAVGNNATSSATPWQVFATTVGVSQQGTATSSGGLTFRKNPNDTNYTPTISLLDGKNLVFKGSVGGDAGDATIATLTNAGALTLASDLAVNGSNLTSTASTFNLLNTSTGTINFGGAASTLAIGSTGTTTSINGSITLNNSSDTLTINNKINSNLVVQSDNNFNLGSTIAAWKNAYINNVFGDAVVGTQGYWQVTNNGNVITPAFNWQDLGIGGTATSSAAFQVFANSFTTDSNLNSGTIPAGTATTSGNLTFRGGATDINLLGNSSLGFYTSVGGDKGLANKPALFINNSGNSGNIGIGTTTSSSPLYIAAASSTSNPEIDVQTTNALIGDSNFIRFNTRALFGYNGVTGNALIQGIGGKGIEFNVNNNTFGSGTAMAINTLGFVGIGTTSNLGNAQLVVNQTNISGLGDIFTASASGTPKFTIANDGTIKNSLIPNATDTYSLGSDPTAGGKEWDTLYVRQIVTPSTGGIAGYWQLSVGGVLAPANITNDLVIGGNATSSAHFQVFGTGAGANAGNTIINTSTVSGTAFTIAANSITSGNAASISANALTNGNAATISATSLTTGNLLALNGPNPSSSLTGDLINVGSANHTYMTLTNQDLTIGGHKNNTTISSVQKVFVYDTSQDTDGGAWTNDERANAASWYNETLNVANVRGSTRPFPRKAILVATTTKLLIYDAKDNSLWMEFDKGSGSTVKMIGPTTNSTGNVVTALNGKIYFGSTGSSGDVYVIDFKQDNSYRYDTTGYSQGNATISNRNNTVTYTSIPSLPITLPSNIINDLTTNIVNGKTYLAVATRGGANGDTALIDESDEQLTATYGPASIPSFNVWLTSAGTLYATIGSANATTPANFALKIKYNAQNGSGTTQLFDEFYVNRNGTSNYGGGTSDTNTFGSLAPTAGPASTSATFVPSSIYVTQGTSTVDGKSDTVYLGAQGSGGSVMAFQLDKGTPASGSIKYYTKNYISDDLVGDVRAMYPLDTNVGSGLSDVSVEANTLSNGSTPPNNFTTSGVRNKAMNLSTTAQSVVNSTANLQLTFKNAGGLSASGWVDPTTVDNTNGVRHVWISEDQNGSANALAWGIGTKGDGTNASITCFVGTGTNTITDIPTTIAAVTNTWYHVAITSDSSGNVKCYVNGQLLGRSDATAGTAITPTQFEIGNTRSTTAITGIVGNVDEVEVAASTFTSSEITHMYQVGYRALQNHSSSTIRGVNVAADASQQLAGSNSNVTAVAASMQNGKIYVGTSNGSISVIGMDSDTINDLYNSSITTTDDTGTSWSSNNNFVNSISLGQSYGNGMLLAFGSNNSNNGGVWMESQDTTLKDFFAANYNPFGATLDQSNLNVDSLLRVTNQLSTRLDNLAFGATASAALADAFRVDNNGTLLSRSLINSTSAVQFQDASANTYLRIDTAAGSNDTAFNLLQPGSGDILIASNSSMTQFRLTNGGIMYTREFIDLDNTNYFLDPANTGTSLIVAGNVGIGTTNPIGLLDVRTSGNMNLSTGTTFAYIGTANRGVAIGQGDANAGAIQAADISGNSRMLELNPLSGSPGVVVGGGTFPGSAFEVDGNAVIGTTYAGTAAPTDGLLVQGNVGIGTTAPQVQLQIAGSASVSGNFTFYSTVNGTIHAFRTLRNGILQFQRSVGGDGVVANTMTLDSTGNVGIGTTAPTNTLQVASDVTYSSSGGTGQLTLSGATNGAKKLDLGYDTGSDFGFIEAVQLGSAFKNLALQPSGGNVGIGTTAAPVQKLDVTGDINVSGAYRQGNTAGITLGNCGATKAVVGTGAGGNEIAGGIWIKGVCGTVNVDYAENYHTNQNVDAGDVIAIDNQNPTYVIKSTRANDSHAIGIVSTMPGLVIGPDDGVSVALNGRVPVKVNLEGGPIHAGDALTTSSIPGVAKKATTAGVIIGKAMEDYDGSVQQSSYVLYVNQKAKQDLNKDIVSPAPGVGKIMAFVNTSWYDPDVYLTSTGNFNIADQSSAPDFTIPHYFTLNDALGNPVTRMGAFLELAVGNFRVGSVNAQQILTNSLAVATDNVSIAGQRLSDYIVSVVNSAINNGTIQQFNNGNINSPIADVDQLHTNLISPLASNSAIALDLTNSRITVKNSASGSAVATIDNAGNATFSGTLTGQNLTVNGDATVSGTLHADRIEANSIAGLQEVVGTLSAQNITNVTNIYFATPSGNTNGENIATGSGNSGNNSNGLLASGSSSTSNTPQPTTYASIASFSAYLSYVPNLHATTGMFEEGLIALGPSTFTDTSVTGTLSVDNTLTIADNSINVLGADLQLQPLKQGGISFESGLVAIDTSGNLTVNGNALFNGTLAAKVISPIAGSNLTLQLGNTSGVAGTDSPDGGKLVATNASGSAVFQLDQLGNVIASGAAQIAKLNLTGVDTAYALSSTEVVATGSAGTAQINQYQTQVTIDDPNVTAKSLIYITPVGTTDTPYLMRQVPGTSFTVGISGLTTHAVPFNWLIVN